MYGSGAVATIIIVSTIVQVGHGGPPLVDKNPIYLNSFLPAAMQIIAHITELMKFDLRPSTGAPTRPTTTTMRPTRPHKPGIFGPGMPPGPEAYFAKGLSYEEYLERLQQPSGHNYFDRYFPLEEEGVDGIDEALHQGVGRSLDGGGIIGGGRGKVHYSIVYGEVPQDLELYLGRGPSDVLKLVDEIEEFDFDQQKNADDQVQEFSQVYDDSNFRFHLLKQKKAPPTKAYVSLLFLYDLMNKESKKLGLNKFNGYSQTILNKLIESSTGTSAEQLRTVLSKVSQRKDTKNPQILTRVDNLVKDLDDDKSYLNMALREIPPLRFVP